MSLIALVLSVASILLIIGVNNMIQDDRKATAQSQLSQRYDLVKLQTCYEHAINPCDDTGIAEWNANNPDQAFSLTRPSL